MRRKIRQFYLIARSTAIEGAQQPIALLLTLSCVFLTGLVPLTHLYVFGDEARFVRDSGLGFFLIFGLCVTGFTAGLTVSDELRRGTAAALLAKPVDRALFIYGKWAGGVAVLAFFSLSVSLAILLAERSAEAVVETASFHGPIVDTYSGIGALAAPLLALVIAAALQFFRRARFGPATLLSLVGLQLLVIAVCSFVNRAGVWSAKPALQLNLRVLPAIALIFLLLALYSAVATALSTRMGRMGVAGAMAGLLLLGFLADPLLGSGSSPFARGLYAITPDVQHFWLADALDKGGRIPPLYLARAALYSACGAAAVLMLGSMAFSRRDIP